MFGEQRTLDARERLDWLQLIRTDSIGPISFFASSQNSATPAKR